MLERFLEHSPEAHPSAWVHASAVVSGRVQLGEEASVWPGAVIRGDVAAISVGARTNVQDLAVIHPDSGRDVHIGEGVTIGHSAVVHGSRVGDNCLIGMGAVLMASEIGENCLIGAGAVVPPGSKIEPGSMVMGLPAKAVRKLRPEEIEALRKSAADYARLMKAHRDGRI